MPSRCRAFEMLHSTLAGKIYLFLKRYRIIFCLISNFSSSFQLSLNFVSLVLYRLYSLLFYMKSVSISETIPDVGSLKSEPLKTFLCPTRHGVLLGGTVPWKYLTQVQWHFNCCCTFQKSPDIGCLCTSIRNTNAKYFSAPITAANLDCHIDICQ